MRVKLFSNNKEDSQFIANIMKSELVREGISVSKDNFDVGIAIGGDGSFLHMVRQTKFDTNCMYVGINSGTLGFLQEIKPTEINDFIKVLKKEKYKVEKLSFENIIVKIKGKEKTYHALNEVVIRDINLDTMYVDVIIDEVLLEKYVGDGLMVSTPIGSTAYNLSGNGAIIYSGLHTLQITPLAPINNNVYRTLTNSVVLPENKEIKLIPRGRTKDLIIVIDGVNYLANDLEYIKVLISQDKLNCIRLNNYEYTNIINDKFLN